MAGKERVDWIDVARGVAIVMVVCLHTDGTYLYGKSLKFDSMTWWYLNVVNAACRVCVPLFFMLSGAVILGSPARSAIDWSYVRRLLRILIPLVIWALIYLVFTRSGSRRLPTAGDILGIIGGKAHYHLWFLYSIAGLYIVAPLLNAYACATGERGTRTLGLLWLAIVGGAWVLEVCFGFSIDGNFTRVLPTFVGYFLMGYALRALRPSWIAKVAAAIIFLIGMVACVGITRWINSAGVPYNGVVGHYLNPIVMAMSIATYWLLLPRASPVEAPVESPLETPIETSIETSADVPRSAGGLTGFPIWILTRLGQASFGIYLSHVIFLESFMRFAFKENRLGFRALPVMVAVPIVTLIVTAISWAVTALISRIPVVRRIV